MQNWKNVPRGTKNVTVAREKKKKGTLHVQLMIPFRRPHNNFVYQKESGIIAKY